MRTASGEVLRVGLTPHKLRVGPLDSGAEVDPIFEKIAISELTQESHAEFWEKAHNRSFGNSVNHDPRFCSCRFCSQDRETLRQAIQPLLTGDESEIIDVCYRLRPEVERVIGESQAPSSTTTVTAPTHGKKRPELPRASRECPAHCSTLCPGSATRRS